MDENPVGTPNPLSPATPAQPAEPVQPAAPAEPVTSEPVISSPVAEQPAAEQPMVSQPIAEPVVAASPIAAQSTAEQPAAEPKKSSKKPILIAAIIAILVAIGAAVAAIVILKPFASRDAVPAAIAKLFSVGAPQSVAMEGSITAHSTNEESSFSSMLINFSANANNKTGENSVEATINTTLPGENVFSFDVNELHTAGGDLYLKLSGISDALENFNNLTTGATETVDTASELMDDFALEDCTKDSPDSANCLVEGPEISDVSVLGFLDVFDVVDDEWIHIPDSEFSNLTSLVQTDGLTRCVIGAADRLSEYGSNFASLYNANPFIEYSTSNLGISQKKDTLYRLTFNAEKLTAFINSIGNAGFMNELLACTGGTATNKAATVDEVSSILAIMPTFYVEIDDENNFTRLYLTFTSEDGSVEVSADVVFSYPSAAVKIEVPDYYIDLGDLLAQLLSGFYGVDIIETETIELQ